MASSINLTHGGVEYIHWTATGLPDSPPADAVQASIDGGTTWHTAGVAAGVLSLLVAHPDAVTPDPTAVVAAVGTREMLVRLTDTPEVVIRSGGWLAVK